MTHDPFSRPLRPGVSRRTFLKSTAAVAGTTVVAGSARPSPRPDDPDVLRIGLVGCGGRGTGAALQALNAEDGTVQLVAMADAFQDKLEAGLANLAEALGEEKAARLAVDEEHRFVGFDAFQKLIDSDVDVVLLGTPPHFRPQHLAAAIAAGKHVFCEKPMAVDAPGARSVMETVKLAHEKKLALVSGFCWRYNVCHRAIYGRILDGEIGALRSIYSTYNTNPLRTNPRQPEWSDMEWQLRNWQHFNWLSGDHITEQAVHSLDKMAWVMGDVPPLSVTAIGGRQARSGPETGDIYDHFGATFEYPGGVQGFHMTRQIANCSNDNSDFVHGETGVATLNGWADRFTIEGAKPWAWEGEKNNMYQQEHDELFASIRAGEPINDGEWMIKSTMLAIMARMAAYTGQTITWEQALGSEERLGPESYAWAELPVGPVPIPGQTRFV